MEKKQHLSNLPNGSFLISRRFFHYNEFEHSVCLLEFGFYDETDELCYTFHILLDNALICVFDDYFSAVDYLGKLA